MLTRRDVFWGYTAQALNIGVGLIMLPVILRFMPSFQVGLWFVFVTIASLTQLLELGFQPTIARNVSYLYAGAQQLSATGLSPASRGPLNLPVLATLLASSQWIYRRIAFGAGLLLLVGGTAYIATLLPEPARAPEIIGGWILFSLGTILNFYFGYLNAFLQGRGDQSQANQVIVVSRLVQICAGSLMVMAGQGLLGLGAAALLSTAASRMMARRFLEAPGQPALRGQSVAREDRIDSVRVLWHNASRFGAVLVGAFLITRANILVASSSLGLAQAASYGLAVQLLIVVQTLASVPFNLALPRLNALRAQNETSGLYRHFGAAISLGLLISIAGGLALVVLGPPLLKAAGSHTDLPAMVLLIVMAAACALETNHGNCGNFLATSNTITFVRPALVTGLLIVTGSILSAPTAGIAGLVMCNAGFQLAYNNWKWPMEAARVFQVPFAKLIGDGLSALVRPTPT